LAKRFAHFDATLFTSRGTGLEIEGISCDFLGIAQYLQKDGKGSRVDNRSLIFRTLKWIYRVQAALAGGVPFTLMCDQFDAWMSVFLGNIWNRCSGSRDCEPHYVDGDVNPSEDTDWRNLGPSQIGVRPLIPKPAFSAAH
jgi:hypothetical protein